MSLSTSVFRLAARTVLAAGLLLTAAGASAETYNMPQFGRHEKQVTEAIDFYDLKGTGNISGSGSNSFATVVFQPANPGEAVQICFSRIHLKGDGANYPVSLSVFDGNYNEDITYPETTTAVTPTDFPDNGKLLERFAAFDKSEITRENLTYTSSEPDGSLSVCFLYKYANVCQGWEATVTSVKLVDQELRSVTADYSAIPEVAYPGLKDITLGSLNIATEGLLNPFRATSLSFSLADDAGALENIRLYHGSTLIETAPEINGSTYTYTFDRPLANGDNRLTVKADIREEAPFYSSATMRFTDVSTTAAVTPAISGGEEGVVNVSALVLMPSDDSHRTYTVQEGREILFYDSGGPDGKYFEKKNGVVTFRPADGAEGKVMIDFSMLGLFNTSSTGLNDVFVIYNGTEVNPDNVLATLLKETKYRARSTSPDGALTVAFTTKTGVPKDGWNSVVKLFTPQAMSLRGTDISAASSERLAAGDAGCAILKLDIVTENTEPAMTFSALSLNFDGTAPQWSKATLYSTGNTGSFSADKAVAVGEVQVNAETVTMTFPAAVHLAEGDNYFWLTADVAPSAPNGSKVNVSVTSLTLNGQPVEPAAVSGETGREVYNIIYPSAEHPVKTVYGSMFMANKPYSSTYGGYEGSKNDLLVTFLPASEGAVCEIDFSKLYLYFYESQWYPSSNVNPRFKIFAGTDTDGELLYELTKSDNDTFKDNPAAFGLVRSTAADGSLTILFNADATGSSSCKDSRFGFLGEVREYISRPMTVTGATAYPSPLTSVAVTKARNIPVMRVNVTVQGNLDPIAVDKLVFALKADPAVYSGVRLAFSGKRADAASAETVAEGEITDGSVTFTPAEVSLTEGDNNFWLMADISAGAAPGSVVDASVTALTAGGQPVEVADSDPEGEILTVNTYDPVLGDKEQVVEVGEYPVLINGVTAPYMTNEYTILARPALAGGKIIAKFTEGSFNVNTSNQYITVLGGEGPVGIDNETVYPVIVTSTREDGTLTIEYHSMTIGKDEGWKCELTCDARKPLVMEGFKALPAGSGEATRGSESLLYGIEFNVTGDKDPITISSFEFSVPGSGNIFSELRLYSTGESSEFLRDNVIAVTDGTSAIFIPEQPLVISEASSQHFWLAGSVKTDAEVGSSTSVAPVKLIYSAAATPAEADLSDLAGKDFRIVLGFHGTYRIGSSDEATYPDFGSAVRALAAGIEGPVTFIVEPGTYNERVELDHIQGVSPENTITFRGESEDPSDVVISWNKWTEPPYSDDKLEHYYGVVTLRGTSHVALRYMSMTTTSIDIPAVLHIAAGSSDIDIDGCIFTAPKSGTTYNNLALINSYVSPSASALNNNLTVRNSDFNGGYTALKFGSGSISQPESEGLTVDNCTFTDQGYQAVYAYFTKNVTVTGNYFTGNAGSADKNYCQIVDLNISGPASIERNILKYSKNGTYGFYFRGLKGSEESPVLIANNVLDIGVGSKPGAAIQLYNSNQTPFTGFTLAHNSVRASGSDISMPLIINVKAGTVVDGLIADNLFQNVYGSYVIKEQYGPSGATYRNNAGYTSNPVYAYWGGSYDQEMSFNQWALASGETDGLNVEIRFDDTDPSRPLFPLSADAINAGHPLAAVPADILGNPRNSLRPTIGAYEVKSSSVELTESDSAGALAAGGTITASGSLTLEAYGATARIFGLNGVLLRQVPVDGPTVIDLAALPGGLYILSLGERSCKLLVR